MTPLYDSIEKLKAFSFGIWLTTFLFVAFSFRFIKEGIAFILVKLYEFFIQRNSIS